MLKWRKWVRWEQNGTFMFPLLRAQTLEKEEFLVSWKMLAFILKVTVLERQPGGDGPGINGFRSIRIPLEDGSA